jgi:hypothetical protein
VRKGKDLERLVLARAVRWHLQVGAAAAAGTQCIRPASPRGAAQRAGLARRGPRPLAASGAACVCLSRRGRWASLRLLRSPHSQGPPPPPPPPPARGAPPPPPPPGPALPPAQDRVLVYNNKTVVFED